VEVLHGRLDVRVTHPFLYAPDIGLGDHACAERVSQVVEAQPPQIGVLQGLDVSARKRPRVDVATPVADEDEVVVSGAVFAIAETR
jgi:hypothetical protein